jgi:phosphomevalonate kinase
VKVRAPGKLMLTGSYVVLEGAPAIVSAVDRFAVADDATIDPAPSAEIAAAMTRAPRVDTSALYDDGKKLGLGSSAAALVAALGCEAAVAGDDLADLAVRRALFERARAAHAAVQGGGSGVDLAASVYGGTIVYTVDGSARPVTLPRALVVEAWSAGRPARTSDMRARVDAFAARAPAEHRAIFTDLAAAAQGAVRAVEADDAAAFVRECRFAHGALAALARGADAPIIPEDAHALDGLAERASSVFLPSGAGGGDVFVRLSLDAGSRPFATEAERLGWKKLTLGIDHVGVSRL